MYFSKKFLFFWITSPLVVLSLYCILIEPRWLEVVYYRIRLPVRQSIKIAHLADFHTKGIGFIEKSILTALDREKPDLIAITGDLVTPGGTLDGYRAVLSKLSAALGVWFVQGNWENWTPIENENLFFKSLNIGYLSNRSVKVRDDIELVGLDDWPSGYPNIERAFEQVDKERVVIALIHSPQFNEKISERVSLTLAGHTHGGQVKIPFFGPLWLPEGSGKYVSGWYEFNRSRMFVSRGIGTSILPVRFFSRPEIMILQIDPIEDGLK